MSETGCKILSAIKQRIENGEDPDKAIPYSVGFLNHEDYIELLYYAKQVLPEGRRKDEVSATLERILKE
jgi:hypothetical protein